MKKGLLLMTSVLLMTGCGAVETEFAEGTYVGSAIDTYGGVENVSTADLAIDADGNITSIYLDTTYTIDNVGTTKKSLGDEYGMKSLSETLGEIEGGAEWYEQVAALEAAIIENQGTDFLILTEDGKTDAVSGCTISIDSLVEATNAALEEARN
ncbi:MAG: FMN-binding protein [Mycoplasmatota bacterium]